VQVREQAVDAVGHRRTGWAAGLVARAEHEVVDEQLGSCIEELDQRLLAVVRVEAVLLLHPHPGQRASLPRELVAEPGVLLFADEQLLACGEPFFTCSDVVISHFFSPSLSSRQLGLARASTGRASAEVHRGVSRAYAARVPATSAAFWRSSALAGPARQLSAIVADIGSGKISSSPVSNPPKMPRATASGEVFGTSRSRTMSVSMGPAMTACTLTPRPARRARSDCESENEAAFEIEQAGRTGTAANAATGTTLTTAPPVRVSSGRNASVTPHVPKRTARCCSSTARSLNSAGSATPALLKTTSSDPP